MANKDLVSEEVLQELITKLEELVNNYCHNLEYYTDDDVQDFFQASSHEITYYNGLINDNITSKNFLWSSKKISEELANAIIEADSYADNLVKNIASIKLKYVTSLPTSNISENTIYILKASDGTSKDTLNLYNETDGWTSIGDFNISLDDYYTKTEIDTKMDLKANVTEVIANDKIVQTLDSATNSTDTVLSTSGLQVEIDKKANDDEVIKKTSLVTSIDSSSSNEQIPSAKAVYDNIQYKYLPTLHNVDVLDYIVNNINKEGFYTFYVADDCTNTPRGNWTRMFVDYLSATRIIVTGVDIRSSNNTYEYRNVMINTWSGWQKVCTTSVADVSPTYITLNSGFTGTVIYEVKNGICYVNVMNLSSTATGVGLIMSENILPKPSIKVITKTIHNDLTNTKTGMVYIDPDLDSKLRVHIYSANINSYCTLSYPVSEP